jgi:hypothetical protein
MVLRISGKINESYQPFHIRSLPLCLSSDSQMTQGTLRCLHEGMGTEDETRKQPMTEF